MGYGWSAVAGCAPVPFFFAIRNSQRSASKVSICLSTLQVRIVIIDSVTFHFRQDFDDMALRTRVLSGLSLKLMKIAKTYNLAVICLSCL